MTHPEPPPDADRSIIGDCLTPSLFAEVARVLPPGWSVDGALETAEDSEDRCRVALSALVPGRCDCGSCPPFHRIQTALYAADRRALRGRVLRFVAEAAIPAGSA